MVDQKKAGMISGMSPLAVITGDELMEVSSRQTDGTWKTFSININKIRTNQGLSAYEVAVVNGFEGTQEEWLESLKGDSAYAVAVTLGYQGTVDEWLESLVGQSAYESAVAEGFNGTLEEWLDSLKGQSAYQLAELNGFEGSETDWLESLKGMSAYQLAKEIDPTVGSEEDWLASLKGKSAFEQAVEQGYTGSEEEWVESLHGQSTYQLWLAVGNEGTEEDFLESLIGKDGESTYQTWLDQGNVGTEAEFLEWLRGDTVTRATLQNLLNDGNWTIGNVLRTLSANGAVVSNAGYLNFLFLFDKRINTDVNTASSNKEPQRMVEMGRMEAEGYSYWKNESASTNRPTGKLPSVPESEIRLLDAGKLQIGSLDKYIELSNSSQIKVVTPEGIEEYDLSKNSAGGAVFIVDVKPQLNTDNVGDKEYVEGDITLESCLSTTRNVVVDVVAITGHSRFVPIIEVNGELVTISSRGNNDVFEGSVNVTVGNDGRLIATHNDGAIWNTQVNIDSPPVVESAVFSSEYPGDQTEAKAGDLFSVTVTSDTEMVAYEIADSGSFTATTGELDNSTVATISGLTVANRGNVTTEHGFRIRVQKSTGAWSDWYNSTQAGNTDLVNVIKLNNLYPVITFSTVVYPVGQSALKGDEQAIVNNNITNFDTVRYNSIQLDITDEDVYEAAKQVTRVNGTYNNSTTNFSVTARRNANGAETTSGRVVAIANVSPTITVTTPSARLRSGGTNGTVPQNHVITITSDQTLVIAPTMNAPAGTWIGAGFTGNAQGTVWTRTLRVNDSDAKGTFSWNSLVVKSLSGIDVNTITTGEDYVLGGFVFRTLTVPAFPNREVDIGTDVSNTSKLRATNLSKGGTGSLNITYQSDIANAADRYTITGPTGVANPEGNLWYNADGANASSNTSGVMRIEIEEVV